MNEFRVVRRCGSKNYVVTAQVSGDDGSKLQEPAANGLVGDVQTSLREHILHIAKAQREPGIQPDRMADDVGREAVPLE